MWVMIAQVVVAELDSSLCGGLLYVSGPVCRLQFHPRCVFITDQHVGEVVGPLLTQPRRRERQGRQHDKQKHEAPEAAWHFESTHQLELGAHLMDPYQRAGAGC